MMSSTRISERAITLRDPLPVRPGCHAQVRFDIAAPQGTELTVDHLNRGCLLAREHRPLATCASALEIKTHPEASHIACSLHSDDFRVNGVRFTVDCGDRIESTGRNFIVIGAMKAGTTTLFALLAQHPALCQTWAHVPDVSFPKEINYFRHLYRKGNTPLHYDWRFPFNAAKHAWTLDVSPNYAKWPGSKATPARIASLGGSTKLAYILRNPVDRIESHIAHMLSRGEQVKHMQHCIRTSCYALQLDKFMAHFPREDILLLDFEQLRNDRGAILTQVCDFLGIERIVSHSVVHNTRGFDFHLDARKRTEFAEAVRPDVQRLISVYGFEPAETWLQ